jgi:hypothetical protein
MSESKIFEFKNEDAVVSDPASCSGNACASISLSATFHPGTLMVKSIKVTNSSSRLVRFKLVWGGAFNPCNSESTASIQPNQSVELESPNQYITGYCSCVANYQ